MKMLERQAVYFYSCLQDYEAFQTVINSDRTVVGDFITQTIKGLNDSNSGSTVSSLQSYVKIAPLESSIALSHLGKFDNWLLASSEKENMDLRTEFNASITEKIVHVLKDGIFDNITSLLELQLLETGWSNLLLSANDWVKLISNNLPSFRKVPPETKHWARLTTHFDNMIRNSPSPTNTTVVQQLGFIALHAAKVARRQGNNVLAEKLTTIASEIPTTKYPAIYEQSKLLFIKADYSQAMQKANEVLTYVASVPDFDELKSKTYLKIARYLKNCPDSEVDNLLCELSPKLVHMDATRFESSAEVSIKFSLEKSIENNTMDGRPWFEYATYYYKQSWRILDDMLRENPTVQAVVWATDEIEKALVNNNSDTDVSQKRKVIIYSPFFLLLITSFCLVNIWSFLEIYITCG